MALQNRNRGRRQFSGLGQTAAESAVSSLFWTLTDVTPTTEQIASWAQVYENLDDYYQFLDVFRTSLTAGEVEGATEPPAAAAYVWESTLGVPFEPYIAPTPTPEAIQAATEYYESTIPETVNAVIWGAAGQTLTGEELATWVDIYKTSGSYGEFVDSVYTAVESGEVESVLGVQYEGDIPAGWISTVTDPITGIVTTTYEDYDPSYDPYHPIITILTETPTTGTVTTVTTDTTTGNVTTLTEDPTAGTITFTTTDATTGITTTTGYSYEPTAAEEVTTITTDSTIGTTTTTITDMSTGEVILAGTGPSVAGFDIKSSWPILGILGIGALMMFKKGPNKKRGRKMRRK